MSHTRRSGPSVVPASRRLPKPEFPLVDLLNTPRGGIPAIIMDTGTLRITEAELARDIHAVLARVQQSLEVVVEQHHRPVAVIHTPIPKGRLLSESIVLAEARGTTAIPDMGFKGLGQK